MAPTPARGLLEATRRRPGPECSLDRSDPPARSPDYAQILHLVDDDAAVDVLEQLHAAPPGHAGPAATYFAAVSPLCRGVDRARQGQGVTIYAAEVRPEQAAVLHQAYTAALARGLPPEVIRACLVPPQAGGTSCRLVVVWGSRAAREASREAAILSGFELLRGVGGEPRRSAVDPSSSSFATGGA